MLLKVGSKGDDVKKLQTKLGTAADGAFGPGTEKLVKEWQAKNGLTADGIVGDGTWKKMFPGEVIKEDVVIPTGGPFKLEKLKGHIPEAVIAQIPDTANLNYSADGLKKIFPKYFPGNLSESYARNPEKIASKVYGGRMGNGDEASKDGFKFRGRGYIQLTGKSNYSNFAKFIGEDTVANPDLVATKYPLASAAFFFDSNKLWSICDKGADDATVTAVTKRVNGGTIGLADRTKHFKEYYNLLK